MEKQSLLAIKQNKLLQNIDSSALDFSNIKGELKTLNQGAILFREGYKADSIYLIISGEMNILKKNLYGKTQSLIYNDNNFFGYNEIVDGGIRTSTAVALRDAYLIELSIEELGRLMSQSELIEKNLKAAELETDSRKNQEEEIQNVEEPESDETIENPEEEINEDKLEEIKDNNLDTSEEELILEEEGLEELLNDNLEDEIQFEELIDENIKPEDEIEENLETEDSGEIDKIYEDKTEINKFDIDETELDDLVAEQTGPGEFEIKGTEEETDDHFHLDEPKDQTEVSKVTDPDDEIPKEAYHGKNQTSKITADKVSEEETEQFSEEDEAFFAGLEDNNSKVNPDSFVPTEESDSDSDENQIAANEQSEVKEDHDENLKMNDRFNVDDQYPTEIVKEDILEEDFFDEDEEKSKMLESIEEEEKESRETESIKSESNELTSEQLKMINKAAHSVTSNVKIEEVLNNIVEAARELTGADRGTLYLVDKESNELWSKIATESEVREIRLKIGEGIAGWVASSGEIVNISNVDEDDRFKRDYDRSSGYKTKNMLCFPLKNKESDIIGVIQLLNSKNGEFSQKDEQFLDALSAHASAALINAELVERLLKSERVTSLGKMANFLIQDIKKPVLVSKRYAEHLMSKEIPKDVKQVLEMMLEQLNHVADIVQTTSSYSEGKSVLRAVSSSLNEALDDYINRVDTYLRNKGCSITTQYDLDVNVKIDIKEFFQCFNHLVKNACEAMPDGGSILVSTNRNDSNVDISFKDSGLGIPDTMIDKIFEPFMTHGKKEGTGLGLSITKKIVEDHSGSISVNSDLGEGTTFTITLPISTSF